MPRSPFDSLVRDGVLTQETLAAAVKGAHEKHMSVGWVLQNEYKVPLQTVGKALSLHFKVPFVAYREDLKALPDLVRKIGLDMLTYYRAAPIARDKGSIVVVLPDPGDLPLVDQVQAALGAPLSLRVALEEDVTRILTGRIREPLPAMPPGEPEEQVELGAVVQEDGEAPMVQVLNMILVRGLEKKATELRIDRRAAPPIALRIDGAWAEIPAIPNSDQYLVRRLKVMANLDIGNRAKAQRGFFQLQLSRNRVRFDVSIEPLGGGDEAAIVTFPR